MITSITHGSSDGGGSPRRVAGVHPGLLDVLHHTADQHLAGSVTHRVDVDLDRAVEEAVDEHRTVGGESAFTTEAAVAGEGRPSPRAAGPRRGRCARPCRRGRSSGARARSRRPGRRHGPGRGRWRCLPEAEGCRGRDTAGSTSRSSAASIDLAVVPATSSAGISAASFSGVCSPRATITLGATPPAVAVSAAMTLCTSSAVSGSKYKRSSVP